MPVAAVFMMGDHTWGWVDTDDWAMTEGQHDMTDDGVVSKTWGKVTHGLPLNGRSYGLQNRNKS